MKVSRTELKQIIKECLLEIFAETASSPLQERKTVQQISHPRRVIADNTRMRSPVPTPTLKTGDQVLDDILKDTAATTLPKMMESEGKKVPSATGVVERIVESTSPEELFGTEAVGNWAALAFGEISNKS